MGVILSGNAHIQKTHDMHTLGEIIEELPNKYTITGTVEKILYQTDRYAVYRLKIDNFDTTSTEYIFPSHRNIGILIEVPKNLTVHSGDQIQYTGNIRLLNWDHMSGFDRYMWHKYMYGKSTVYTFYRVKEVSSDYYKKLRDSVKGLLFRGFPRDIAGVLG